MPVPEIKPAPTPTPPAIPPMPTDAQRLERIEAAVMALAQKVSELDAIKPPIQTNSPINTNANMGYNPVNSTFNAGIVGGDTQPAPTTPQTPAMPMELITEIIKALGAKEDTPNDQIINPQTWIYSMALSHMKLMDKLALRVMTNAEKVG